MKTEYTYDKANRITAVSTPLGVQSVFYDFAGRVVKSANNATGAEKLIEYDGRGLVSHIKTVADGKTIFEENNTYDKLGNKTISVENGITTKYRYDGMNRLTSVIKGENETVYDFDCYNNIEKKYELFLDNKSTTRYHYDSANRLVMSENGTNAVHYEYDDSGNLTKKTDNNGSVRYSYDGFNRLKSVAFGENVTEYAYTPEGFRSKKTVNGSTTRYLYDGANICAEVIPDGTAYTYYRADGIIGSVHGDEKLYYSQTSRGDVSVVYDTAGNVVKSNTYSPYGERKTVQKVNDTNDPLRLMWVAETEKIHIPFGYCGEYTDDETGFVYLRNRYYDPEVGRFITEDPIRNGVNWYVYAGNNPVSFVDSFGLFDVNTTYSYNSPYNVEVKVLQNELQYLGYYGGNIDGYYGAQTEAAVQNYQRDKGLDCDGIVGVKTWSSMGLIYRTKQDVDAGVEIVTVGLKQYFDISKPVTSAVEAAKSEFANHYLDVDWFIKKVKNAGEWNVKRDTGVWAKTFGISENSYNTTMIFYGRPVVIDDIGNITYGYLGKAAGFSVTVLKSASMGYHILDHGLNDFGNEFSDEAFVQLGVDWYNGKDIQVRFGAP